MSSLGHRKVHPSMDTGLFFSGASPTKRDFGRGLTAAQWSHYCGRHVCAESIEKFVRTALPGGNGSAGGNAGQGGFAAGGGSSGGNTAAKISRQNKEKKKKANRCQMFSCLAVQVNCDCSCNFRLRAGVLGFSIYGLARCEKDTLLLNKTYPTNLKTFVN